MPETSSEGTQQHLTLPHKWILAGFAAGSLGLAGMSFWGMFTAVRDALQPWFGQLAWMVPVGTDLGILLTASFGVFLEAIGMPLRWLRFVTLAFIGLQLFLNVGAAHGSLLGAAGHLVLPLLFVTLIEVWQFFIRKRRNLIHKSDRERIPLARYRADWKGTRELKRRMVLWGINRYREALDMMQRVLRAEAALAEIYGSGWRDKTPKDLLFMLDSAKYLDEACTIIAKKRAEQERLNSRAQSPRGGADNENDDPGANGARAGNTDKQPAGIRTCCEIHRLADTKAKKSPEAATALWSEHIRVHDRAPGADILQTVLTIGIAGARLLRDQLQESGAESAAGSGSGSGQAGQVGVGPRVGADRLNELPVPAGGN